MPRSSRATRSTASPGTGPRGKDKNAGKLRIGDQWNAIRIIAMSQSNPLKAIAEFVENSIDAHAKNVSIVRGKSRGEQYLKIIDDGEGVRDFRYVATHIGDSIKRKLKEQGADGIQGEFGIGLLSFWTVGEELTLTSMAEDGDPQRLHLVKDDPSYAIRPTRELFDRPGTTLHVQPLLPGVRMLSGEKIQSYLAAELRDRIAKSGVSITIIDRSARKQLVVEPRRFTGQLIHNLPETRSPLGEIYVELYLTDPSESQGVGLYKKGTRVIADLTKIDAFRHPPWSTGYLEGIIDCSFLQLTPGTREGVLYDAAFDGLVSAVAKIEEPLREAIAARKRAEEEEASRAMLKRITRALKEAFAMLPAEEYGWLNAKSATRPRKSASGEDGTGENGAGAGGEEEGAAELGVAADEETEPGDGEQRAFFEFPGPLYRLDVRPASTKTAVGGVCKLHAIPRDRSRRIVDADVEISWAIEEGAGTLDTDSGEFVSYRAPAEPELAVIVARAVQDGTECEARARITVTAQLGSSKEVEGAMKGLPGYTYLYAPGELWRSRYDVDESLITVNSGHADFVFASAHSATKLRYVARLFAKEIVLANFPGVAREQLLERMVELSLYVESNLR